MSVDYTRDGGMLVLALGSGWMRGRIMCREVIVRCIVAVDALERFGEGVLEQNRKEGEDSAERVGDIPP
jgi:hypothetical protein